MAIIYDYSHFLSCEINFPCYRQSIVDKRLQTGVLIILILSLGVGCKGDSDIRSEAPSLGIPEKEYELFSSLIRNIDAAELKVEQVRPTKNRVALARAQALLTKEREILNLLFTEKYFSMDSTIIDEASKTLLIFSGFVIDNFALECKVKNKNVYLTQILLR